MTCDRVRPLLQQFTDGALGPVRRFLVGRHAAHCPACAAQLEELLSMQALIRSRLPYHRAPPGLAARIGAVLPREARPMVSRPWFRMPSFGFAGAGLAGAIAGVALMVLVTGQNTGRDPLVLSVIDSHVRSMMADHLTDVQISDRHTVKPWLSAHTDVSPPVRDLSQEGFSLVGGRMDYLDGHSAAVVVYRSDRHVINLFAWSAEGQPDTGVRTRRQQGFEVVIWRHQGVAYAAVSDVEQVKLLQFVRLVMEGER